LLAHAFRDVQIGIEPLMSPYREWFEAQDLRPAYAYYRDLLKLLDWQRPGKRWLLKSPAHLWALDVLVELFPDCSIVQTHRDPPDPRLLLQYDGGADVDRELRQSRAGARGSTIATAITRRMRPATRPALHDGLPGFLADPMATVERIYAHFALPLAAVADAMRAHVAANPQAAWTPRLFSPSTASTPRPCARFRVHIRFLSLASNAAREIVADSGDRRSASGSNGANASVNHRPPRARRRRGGDCTLGEAGGIVEQRFGRADMERIGGRPRRSPRPGRRLARFAPIRLAERTQPCRTSSS
jgi:hypothetical protein